MITTKQLTYALAVEKTLHFKKTAEACHISQSALSTALNELEKQLGFTIFERDNKKVLLTPIGKEVLDRARVIIQEINDLQSLADGGDPLNFPMTIGIIPTIAPYMLPRILPDINAKYPNSEITVVEEQSHVLVDMVRNGELDTAVLAMPYPCDGLMVMDFWEEDFYWIATKGAAHTDQQEITSDELLESNLMLLKEGHCLKDHILQACKFPEPPGNHGFSATSLHTLIQMVRGEMGTTLIPEMALNQLISQDDNLTTVHLDEPSPHRKIAFIMRPNYTRMRCIEALIELSKLALSH
ncbi:hydrogen peroxide-inducible genes activator [Curvivirga aplysinae]|uniref:hydrogen peroxide-inducible genes activator n=1 Tax=Curvivirga aplysinae TaxID=2529852 RepID=UPI0012BC1921|nr:hydrogen peroxide-inducible genes activator [Curvivirga aplysinae]MTI10329.1 hydrogen peroxide-inducible genes activator [Curvivirga aplysinae]